MKTRLTGSNTHLVILLDSILTNSSMVLHGKNLELFPTLHKNMALVCISKPCKEASHILHMVTLVTFLRLTNILEETCVKLMSKSTQSYKATVLNSKHTEVESDKLVMSIMTLQINQPNKANRNMKLGRFDIALAHTSC